MRPHGLTLLLLAPLLAACQDVYHPLKGGVGFMEIPTGTDTFQISYLGDSGSAVPEARRFAMLRASELAVLRDMPYFQITQEQIFLSYGSRYWPGSDTRYVETYPDRRGHVRAYIYHAYDPGYTEFYMVPDVEMQVRLTTDAAAPSIPAAYLLRQAQADKIKLSAGVAERLPSLPDASGPVTLPPEPKATTKPGIVP